MEGVTKTQQIRSANVVSRDLANCSCQFCTMWWCLQAAVDMMRKVLNTVNMDGVIVIGEGEKDEVTSVTCFLVGMTVTICVPHEVCLKLA